MHTVQVLDEAIREPLTTVMTTHVGLIDFLYEKLCPKAEKPG